MSLASLAKQVMTVAGREALTTVVGGPAGRVVGVAVEEVLREVLSRQDEQLQLLKGLRDDVQKLINGPWETGRRYLELASRPGQPDVLRTDYLMNARGTLFEALSYQPQGSVQRASVASQLSVVMGILGDVPGCREYAQSAYIELIPAARRSASELRRTLRDSHPGSLRRVLPKFVGSRMGFWGAINSAKRSNWKQVADLEEGREIAPSLFQYPEAEAIVRLHQTVRFLHDLRDAVCELGTDTQSLPYFEVDVRVATDMYPDVDFLECLNRQQLKRLSPRMIQTASEFGVDRLFVADPGKAMAPGPELYYRRGLIGWTWWAARDRYFGLFYKARTKTRNARFEAALKAVPAIENFRLIGHGFDDVTPI